ncbi:response regulator [Azospirillum doebereinerae]|uniref:hybrid sensor histidine kinase/response regulator n=1 Tax=Azospirillum doebereinerae TaxID=92933 RepID=UPI001EE5BD68|nr:response regulator [Azospirillum doebereinerae]MCG5242943.1 response regulator [Azospirillum doebereinerae]
MPVDSGPYALMAELLDSVNVGVCLFDSGDHALLWNRSFLTLFPEHDGHIHAGEHYALNLRRFYLSRLDPDELPLIDRYIEEGVARHRGQTQPFVFQHRGQWVRVAATSTADGGRVRVWTPLASPTGAGQWNRPSAAQPGPNANPEEAFLEQFADGVMLLDDDGRIAKANEQVLFLYDVPRKADLIGLRYDELLNAVWRGQRPPASLTERQRFNGAPFEVELPGDRWLRVAEQRGVDGIAYSTHVDITEMKRLQTALNRAKEEADRASAAKSRFLAMISHEIRTPMNAIIGIGRIALKATAEPGLRGYLDTINASAGRLLGIMNDLLDFSKIEAGKVEIVAQPFSLDEVLEPLGDLVMGSAKAGGGAKPGDIEVAIRVAPGTPDRLVGDPLRLGQVLANLTANALKFTERGEILVTVEEVARAGGSVTLGFQVADSGIGIDAAQQGQLFQPFVQADDMTTRRYGGTGLGLTICKQLVDLMGGAITLSSAPGRGSRFGFTVDLQLAPKGADAPARLAGRVLVVDDHPAARAALAEMVTALGCEAVEAESAVAALLAAEQAAAQGRPVAAALVDWPAPGWDGRAAVIPALALVPAKAEVPLQTPESGTGVAGVLFKPVTPGRLRDRLAGLLGGQGDRTAKPAAERRDLSALRGARVLLVDDNALNREVALHLLAEARVTVEVAENGLQAFERVGRGDYDLVLMDIQMPVMDGLEATRRIRRLEQDRFRDLPIVAMTAQAMSAHRQASREAGLDEHLAKPIEPDRLFDTMLRLIDPARLTGRQPPPPADDGPAGRDGGGPRLEDIACGDIVQDARRAGLDWDAALRRVDNDPTTLHRLMRSFRRDCADYPAALVAAVAAGDQERIRFLAHALRSSCAYIGAMELSRLAGRVDEAVRTDQSSLGAGLATDLAGDLARLLEQLSGLCPVANGTAAARTAAIRTAALTDDTALEPSIRRLAGLLGMADLRAEEVWSDLRERLDPAHRDFAADVDTLLDDLRYPEALDRLRDFATTRGMALTAPPRNRVEAKSPEHL